jgi:hypothetical protein
MISSLYVHPGTLNVGIGTSMPLATLDVNGTIRASNISIIGDFVTLNTVTSNTEQMVIENAGTGPALKVTQTGANSIAEFYDDGSVLALKIADGGNVGIGTAIPMAKLHINDTGAMIIPSGTTVQQPATGVIGMLRFNISVGRLQFYNGTAWSSLTSGTIATGGTTTTEVNGYRIHTFTSSGNLVVINGGEVEYLTLAGGGGGATPADSANRAGGGGGAGGMLEGSAVVTTSTYTITVGAGGSPGSSGVYYSVGTSGTSSSFGSIATVSGGGRGGAGNSQPPLSGGSGGGGGSGATPGSGAAGIEGQGFAGGAGTTTSGASGGAGGGASAFGQGWQPGVGALALGGAGKGSSISGTYLVYARGGDSSTSGATTCFAPRATFGDGGYGGGVSQTAGGGSGIVIIRYRL